MDEKDIWSDSIKTPYIYNSPPIIVETRSQQQPPFPHPQRMKNKLGGCRGSFMCKAERCINACSITPKKSSVFSFWGCPQQTIIMMQTNVICSYYVCTLAADPMSMYTNIYRMLTYIMQVQPSWWLFRHYLVVRSSWLSKLINSSRSTCFLESDNCTNSSKYLHIYKYI